MTTRESYDFINGEVLLFDKNYDWTSFDLVNRVRYLLCRKLEVKKLKVGHAGTLDPLATGLMILCTGKSTKLIDTYQAEEKEYVATLKLGATTPSFDLETEEDSETDASFVTTALIEQAMQKFMGVTEQIPPVFSAVKINGKRAFSFARNGEVPELQSRKITISEIELLSFEFSEIIIRVVCSKGTYIRALARDLGTELGCGAYLTGLRRTRIGNFNIEDAMTVDFFSENLHRFETN
ncbi:MAG: tRNA pseudouridine(55) synthase TruB [Draconibacterium sp.]